MRKFLTITLLMGVLIALAGWLGLPAMLTAMGLHPDYEGERFPFRGRALIVTTSHDRLGDEGATGVFASEMTAPYYVFRDAGAEPGWLLSGSTGIHAERLSVGKRSGR